MRVPAIVVPMLVLTLAAPAVAQTTPPGAPTAPAPPSTPQIKPSERPAPPPITLAVGDKAPALAPEVWVKGDPIDGFAPGTVHVVEFWATWCGPCISAIPHLTELQKKNPDAIFIGMAGSERVARGETEDNRLAKVRDFVSSKGDVMGYRVAFTPERKIADAWLAAAGRTGIPCTFIVGKEGVIEWIGHPMQMDEPLAQVIAGSWDREAAAKKSREENMARRRNAEAMRALAQAQAAGDWDAALKVYDDLIAATPSVEQLRIDRFKLLAGRANRSDAASAYATELFERFKGDKMALNDIAWFVVDDRSVKNRDLDLALKFAERANEVADSDDAAILDTLARIWWEKGNAAKAVEIQELAVRQIGTEETPMAKGIRAALEKYQAGKP